jgi:hypothetical protein
MIAADLASTGADFQPVGPQFRSGSSFSPILSIFANITAKVSNVGS